METFDHDHELEALQENSRPIIKTKNIDLNQPDEGSLDSSSQIGKLVFKLMDSPPLPHFKFKETIEMVSSSRNLQFIFRIGFGRKELDHQVRIPNPVIFF